MKKSIKKDDNEVRIFIPCACHAEILEFAYWKDELDFYYLTMYKSSYGRGFWWRLKQAWKYFRKGEFEGNEILLNKSDFVKVLDELQKHRPKL